MTPVMASDRHFRVQQAEAVPFFAPTKSSCEFSFEVFQDDVGAEDADDAEAGFRKQSFHVWYFTVLVTDGTRKNWFTFLHDQCPKSKSSNITSTEFPPKIHFLWLP